MKGKRQECDYGSVHAENKSRVLLVVRTMATCVCVCVCVRVCVEHTTMFTAVVLTNGFNSHAVHRQGDVLLERVHDGVH